MLLTHNLSTIELGSISWRQVINQNFVYLDNNRIFVVDADANLPTSGFKANRFFYSKATKSFWYDNGTLLTKTSGGTEINITNNPNKFIKINATGTALEYVDITSGGLSNRVDPTAAATLNSLYVSTDNPTTSNFTNAQQIISFGYKNVFYGGNYYGTSVLGSDNQNYSYYNTIFGTLNKITSTNSIENTIIGKQNENIKGSNNVVIGSNQNFSSFNNTTNSNILIGSNSFLSASGKSINNNILIGNCRNIYSGAIALGYGVGIFNINNSRSFNLALNQIIRKVSYYKSALTSSTLTNIYIDGQSTNTESLNLTPSSFNNISGNITIYNKTTQKCKKISINMIVFVNGGGTPNVKQFTKTTIFEDIEYAGADINFLTTSNQFVLQVNTNNLASDIIAEIDIEEK